MITIDHLQCYDFFNFCGKFEGDTSEADNQRKQIKSVMVVQVYSPMAHILPYILVICLLVKFPQLVSKILGIRNVCHHLSISSCFWQSPIHHMWSSMIIY